MFEKFPIWSFCLIKPSYFIPQEFIHWRWTAACAVDVKSEVGLYILIVAESVNKNIDWTMRQAYRHSISSSGFRMYLKYRAAWTEYDLLGIQLWWFHDNIHTVYEDHRVLDHVAYTCAGFRNFALKVSRAALIIYTYMHIDRESRKRVRCTYMGSDPCLSWQGGLAGLDTPPIPHPQAGSGTTPHPKGGAGGNPLVGGREGWEVPTNKTSYGPQSNTVDSVNPAPLTYVSKNQKLEWFCYKKTSNCFYRSSYIYIHDL